MQQYVVANWKMFLRRKDAEHLAKHLARHVIESEEALPKVILCPSHPYLIPVHEHIKGSSVSLGAQGCHPQHLGPNTGEVGVQQVKDVNAEYVLIGHSEQRREHTERTNEHIRSLAEMVIEHGMIPILCVGETAEERKKGRAKQAVAKKIQEETPRKFRPGQLLVAYEPAWAIGTDKTPTRKEIEEMHEAIGYELEKLTPNGKLIPVLYGGSVDPKNAEEILRCKGVHGVVVGRHGTKLDNLWAIIKAHNAHEHEENEG